MEKNEIIALCVTLGLGAILILSLLLILATTRRYEELDYVTAEGLEVKKTELKVLGGLLYL